MKHGMVLFMQFYTLLNSEKQVFGHGSSHVFPMATFQNPLLCSNVIGFCAFLPLPTTADIMSLLYFVFISTCTLYILHLVMCFWSEL